MKPYGIARAEHGLGRADCPCCRINTNAREYRAAARKRARRESKKIIGE